MRTGRLSISRGNRVEPKADPVSPHLALVQPEAEPAPAHHDLVDHRLTSLERLTRLYEQGVLTIDEFLDEKALILGRAPEDPDRVPAGPVHFVPAAPRAQRRGPSLLGRMLGWRFILFSLVAGLGFSFAIQPDTTSRFFSQLARALGG
ncbi:MAG TPA: hypothetical protein VEX35_06675 [Allosphingosinicella sp.]|nr:hypothetical protein [Allosphingosinicella sp.]